MTVRTADQDVVVVSTKLLRNDDDGSSSGCATYRRILPFRVV